MLLIFSTILIIATPIVFNKAINKLPVTPIPGALPPEYWGTGTRWLQGDFIGEDGLEEMRKKVNNPNSKF